MSQTISSLRRKMKSVNGLQAVVRTMKALAAANLGNYERAVRSLAGYARTVELGLTVCLRRPTLQEFTDGKKSAAMLAIVFGSDQGMVGQFNDHIAALVAGDLRSRRRDVSLWAVGERIRGRMEEAGFAIERLYSTPVSLSGVTELVGEIALDIQARCESRRSEEVLVFHHRPKSPAGYEPASWPLLPLDANWVGRIKATPWPAPQIPEVIGPGAAALGRLIREFFFVSLFRACAESLAAENASRLAAMQAAERNIDELLDGLQRDFSRRRQNSIDEELFDVISGFEALAAATAEGRARDGESSARNAGHAPAGSRIKVPNHRSSGTT